MIGTRGLAGLAATAAILAGCGERASAVQTRDRDGDDGSTPAVAAAEAGSGGAAAEPAVTGAPPMTASRRETVSAKIDRLYRENGADFGARSAEDYLTKVRAFVDHPPTGTERVERPNGDVLLYQASTNTFAVASRTGAPRTMFKPRDGAAYWAEQKAAAPNFGRRRATSPD